MDLLEELNKYLYTIVDYYPDSIKNIISKSLSDKECTLFLEETIEKIKEDDNYIIESFKNFINHRVRKSMQPIIDSIGALPKEELGNMCESLIHITSLRRKVEKGLETVVEKLMLLLFLKEMVLFGPKENVILILNSIHNFLKKK